VIWPEPVLVGRNEDKLRAIAERHGLSRYTTNLDAALAEPDVEIYFDAQSTQLHDKAITRAIEAGKHIYAEKPLAEQLDVALHLAVAARDAGVCTGIVADKLFLPACASSGGCWTAASSAGCSGARRVRLLGLRGRLAGGATPVWNYRTEDGGGVTLDMFCHWDYVLHNLFGRVASVSALNAVHIPERVTSPARATPPPPTTPPTASSSWTAPTAGSSPRSTRPGRSGCFRDELVEFQVDGTRQRGRRAAPLPGAAPVDDAEAGVEPGRANALDFRAQWAEVPDNAEFDNGFKVQWEQFLRQRGARRAVELRLHLRRPRCAAGRAGPALRRRGRPADRARAGPAVTSPVTDTSTGTEGGAAGGPELVLPGLDGRLAPYRMLGRPLPAAAGPRRARGSRTPPRMWSPTRWRTTTPAGRPGWIGTPR